MISLVGPGNPGYSRLPASPEVNLRAILELSGLLRPKGGEMEKRAVTQKENIEPILRTALVFVPKGLEDSARGFTPVLPPGTRPRKYHALKERRTRSIDSSFVSLFRG